MTRSRLALQLTPKLVSWILWIVLLGCVATTVDHYGASWDEHVRYEDGLRKVAYYKALFAGEDPTPPGGHYPGLFDMLHVSLATGFELDPVETGHALSAFFGLLGVLGVFLCGRLLGGEWGGVSALLCVLLGFPRVYGHFFINPKDIPFFAGYALSLWALVRIALAGCMSWGPALLWGAMTGLALGVRIGGLLLWSYAGIVWLFWVSFALWKIRRSEVTAKEGMLPVLVDAIRLGVGAAISLGVLYVVWPAMHGQAVERATDTVQTVQSFGWDLPLLFEGLYWKAAELPFYYLPKMFLMTTHPVMVAILILGGLLGVLRLRRGGLANWSKRDGAILLMVWAAFFPLGYVLIRDVTVYNGIRHLLFVVAPLAVLGALSANALGRRIFAALSGHAVIFRVGLAVFLACAVASSMGSLIRLHPYQYLYFNALADGVRGAENTYELDYWGTASRAALGKLETFLRADPAAAGERWLVNTEQVEWLLTPYVSEDNPFELVVQRSAGPDADFYIACVFWGAEDYYAGEIIAEVRIDGALLAIVKDRRQLRGEEREMFYGENGP